nr:lectin like domain-containing protein [Weissella diestrammenae]
MLDNGGFGNTFTAEKSDTVTLANIFPVNGTNQKVAGINIATPQDGAKISAKVYTEVDPNKGPTAGHLETIEGVNHAVISKKVGLAGYTTLYLPKPVNLKSGSKYAVVVTYKAPDNKPVRFSSEETFSTRLGEFAFDASIQPKESWLSLDGGRSFQDWAGTQAIPGVKDSILAGDIKSTCQRGNFNLKAVITK